MTNQVQDMAMTDVFMICGSNAAENHPITFKWIDKAVSDRGAKIIVVDPRFTRTASRAHIFAQTRPGTDIMFFGALIKYAIDNNKVDWDVVNWYTNAAFLVSDKFNFDRATGKFDGFAEVEVVDPKTGKKSVKKAYNPANWVYQFDKYGPDGKPTADAKPLKDPSLTNPRCVWNLMKEQFKTYTPEMVEKVCGIPQAKFKEIADAYCSTFERGKSGVLLYAMGLTQHSYGSQNIKTFAMLQLILGNTGVPGGGIAALRGCANVQGSTDQALLFHLLPGYNPMFNSSKNVTLQEYIDARLKAVGSAYWKNTDKFITSYMKAQYGDKATPENQYGYVWFPRLKDGVNYSHIALFEAMYDKKVKGMFVVGQNPVVGGPNSNMESAAMDNLDWLVVSEIFDTETPNFWNRPGASPSDIKTEVIKLPAAANGEYEGTFSNTGRVVQWFWQSGDPKGDSKKDMDIFTLLANKLKALYGADAKAPNRESIINLHWPYNKAPINTEDVLKEMNGYTFATGMRLKNFTQLKADGSTACGNWVYSGVFPEEADYPGMTDPDPKKVELAKASFAKTGGNLSKRQNNENTGNVYIYPKWAWCWPVNRRVVYNRLSVTPLEGKPWTPDKKLVEWTGAKWDNVDVPDFVFQDTTNPAIVPPPWVPPNDPRSVGNPFIMLNFGMGQYFSPGTALTDGPFPEHYEPVESIFKNLVNGSQNSPVVRIWSSPMDKLAGKAGTAMDNTPYKIVCGVSRVTEHFQSGTMTRNMPWLSEMQPNMFVELSEDLAGEKGINNGDWVVVKSARGEVECVALVTNRIQPLTVYGKKTHVVNMPYHYGFKGLVTGGNNGGNYAGNQTTPHIGDCNTMTPEYKAFLVDIEKA